MFHRSFFAFLAIVALGTSCADIMGLLTVRAGQPATVTAPRSAVPAVVPQPVIAQQPAGPDHVVVESVTVGDNDVVVAGSTPFPPPGTGSRVVDGVPMAPVGVFWCLLDAAGSGICAQDFANSTDDSPAGAFRYRIRFAGALLNPPFHVRPDATSSPDYSTVSAYLRLLWVDVDEVEARFAATRGRHVSIVPDAAGWAAGPNFDSLECLFSHRQDWSPCTNLLNPYTTLLFELQGAAGDRMVATLAEDLPKEEFYQAFPDAPDSCEFFFRDMGRLSDDIDAVLAGGVPDDMGPAIEAATALVWSWNRQDEIRRTTPRSAIDRCPGYLPDVDRDQAVGQGLLDLVRPRDRKSVV